MTDQTQPTPLRTGQMGLVRAAGASAEAIAQILAEARQWGLLGFDLEWVTLEDGTRVITWCGVGHAGRAVSLWWHTLPAAGQQAIKDAIKDATLPKIAHNIQADIKTWEMNFGDGSVGGLWEDTMLMHHASYPGIAHDLQAVTSQFLVVPPWKTWHRDAEKAKKEADKQAIAAQKKSDRDAVKADKDAQRAADKTVKLIDRYAKQVDKFCETYPESTFIADFRPHLAAPEVSLEQVEALGAQLKEAIPAERDRIKAERKVAKAAAHEAKNAAAAAAKEAKKVEKQATHDEKNAKAAADAEAKKAAKRLFQTSTRVANANPSPSKGSS